MIIFSFKTGRNRAIDLVFLSKYNSLKSGFSLIDFQIGGSWYQADHNPQFAFFLGICNIKIIEICWYNIHHLDDEKI